MTPPHRRLRFSIRTLLILVTLVGVYFGSWPWFEEQVLEDVREHANRPEELVTRIGQNESSPIPFVVEIDIARVLMAGRSSRPVPLYRCYYLWFFGYVVKLPYDQQTPDSGRFEGPYRSYIIDEKSGTETNAKRGGPTK